ncbi:MAG: hypothetical protein K2I29_03660 [Clostridia bacterium]|nr:hypothetical protein [Clostridia bacterium]
MKKWLARILIIVVTVVALVCCLGVDVNCDGSFQGFNCGIDGCSSKHEHSYTVIEETESTCGVAGYVKYQCRKCGNIDTQFKSKPDHELTNVLHRGDCHDGADHDWYEEDVCSNCDYTKRNSLCTTSTLHYYDGGTIYYYGDGSGCGEIIYTCLICGGTKKSLYHCEESPQMQDYRQYSVERTCGIYLKTCELCNKTVTFTWHGEYTSSVIVEPTRTEYGLEERICIKNVSGSTQNCLITGWKWYVLIPPSGN